MTPLFGVWLPGDGWLKSRKETGEITPLAFDAREVAAEVASCVGRGAVVRYVDLSIASIERDYLTAEKARAEMPARMDLWHTWMNWLRRLSK